MAAVLMYCNGCCGGDKYRVVVVVRVTDGVGAA